MLTARAWWLVFLIVAFVVLGVYTHYTILLYLALAMMAWLVGSGVLFLLRVRWVARHMQLRRRVSDERGVVTSLWAGRPFTVHLSLLLEAVPDLPFVRWSEFVPFGADVTGGETEGDGALSRAAPLHLSYRITPLTAGRLRFEGSKVTLADLGGLYCWTTFVRLEQQYRVLPPLVRADAKTATSKRFNLLPPPGINRLQRPGSGSELLDLRDYLPGDPPRTIAWKISARRDRLITKEYESEVPVRCTLFVDTSNSLRLGVPGETPLARLVEVAAATAQANMGVRDLTGLCLFDEHKVTTVLRPARTRRQVIQILGVLADAAALGPDGTTARAEPLLPVAYAFAREVYPESMRSGVNRMPWWLWFASPTPGPWVTPVSAAGRFWRWLVYPLATLFYLIVTGIFQVLLLLFLDVSFPDLNVIGVMPVTQMAYDKIPEEWFEDPEIIIPPLEWIWGAQLLFFALLYPLWIGIWRDSIPMIFSLTRRRQMKQRKQLAALLAVRYDLGPGGLELLFQDDERLGVYLQRFLTDHHVPFVPTMQDEAGQYLFRSPGKIDVLANALLRSVGKGHDNELFVLLVDLIDLEGELAPLLRAVKVALGRHHQVMVVFPWPPGIDLPASEGPELAPPRPTMSPARYVTRHLTIRYHEAFWRLRRVFARLHVPVVCAAEDDAPRLILERLDRLRGMRRRR